MPGVKKEHAKVEYDNKTNTLFISGEMCAVFPCQWLHAAWCRHYFGFRPVDLNFGFFAQQGRRESTPGPRMDQKGASLPKIPSILCFAIELQLRFHRAFFFFFCSQVRNWNFSKWTRLFPSFNRMPKWRMEFWKWSSPSFNKPKELAERISSWLKQHWKLDNNNIFRCSYLQRWTFRPIYSWNLIFPNLKFQLEGQWIIETPTNSIQPETFQTFYLVISKFRVWKFLGGVMRDTY